MRWYSFRHDGSSPLSRGIRSRGSDVRNLDRIIPALAGNTRHPRPRTTGTRDHPRSRGEYQAPTTSDNWDEGSSPLSRGIPVRVTAVPSGRGIIPALAGNTTANREGDVRYTDHPRSRGEYSEKTRRLCAKCGSSPLSRGILPVLPHPVRFARIIPALAGNTSITKFRIPSSRDHPRSRGEYVTTGAAEESGIGSSPLSRGILHHAARDVRVRRIIPALAGNTCSPRRKTHPPGDHPRSRGEYLEAYGLTVWQLGSSPLSRGIRNGKMDGSGLGGIIPALAGNTAAARRSCTRLRDHPRSRGEYASSVSFPSQPTGSSPLSRGIRPGYETPGGFHGIIPALAGNTHPPMVLRASMRDHPRSRGEYV